MQTNQLEAAGSFICTILFISEKLVEAFVIMDLRRLSTMIDPQRLKLLRPTDQRRQPPSPGETNRLIILSRSGKTIPEPVRMTPKPGSRKKKNLPSVTNSGTKADSVNHVVNRQIIPESPCTSSGDGLDGITLLPSTSSIKGPALQSASKYTKCGKTSSTVKSTNSRPGSNIPVRRFTGSKSVVTAKKRLSMSKASSKGTATRAVHQRVQALAQLTIPTKSPLSIVSTSEFEADERAAESATPLVHHSVFPSNINQFDIRKEMKEMLDSHKKFIDQQAKHLDKQEKLIEKQTECLNKQNKLIENQTNMLTKLIKLLDNQRTTSNESQPPSESGESCLSSEEEKENLVELRRSKRSNSKIFANRARNEYNNMRAELNYLSLRTPAKCQGTDAISPKTPKSILSRTLQMQLGDLFEES